MIKIVGIGANVHDTLISVPHFPKEDTKSKCTFVTESGGGPCATGLVAASKLGAECAYVGALADDAGGKFLLSDMIKFGVSAEYTVLQKNASSFASYILLNTGNATRTCVFNKDNLPIFEIDENAKKAIEAAEVLMVDGNELENAVKGAKIARGAKTKVLYDAGGIYEDVEKLLRLTDILIPSEEFSLEFTGKKTAEDAAHALFEMFSSEVVVITQGKEGGIILQNGEIRRYPSFKVNAVDSNGAGDVFHGAFAYGVTKGFSYYDCCVFASAVSALKCTAVGARAAVPSYNDTINFLKECGHDEFKENMER